MSDLLSQLVEINKNIEKQNLEIIRLLKLIAGEESHEEIIEEDNLIFEDSLNVGEVFFIDDKNIFKLTIENNETLINNLTSSSKTTNFKLPELIANESIINNQKVNDGTVILGGINSNESIEKVENLPETLKICLENGASNVFLPYKSSMDLLGAPQEIMVLLNLVFYKSIGDLIEKIFSN